MVCTYLRTLIILDETGGIVLDIGSSSIKLGYGGEDVPRLVYPSVSLIQSVYCRRHMDISARSHHSISWEFKIWTLVEIRWIFTLRIQKERVHVLLMCNACSYKLWCTWEASWLWNYCWTAIQGARAPASHRRRALSNFRTTIKTGRNTFWEIRISCHLFYEVSSLYWVNGYFHSNWQVDFLWERLHVSLLIVEQVEFEWSPFMMAIPSWPVFLFLL